MTWSDQGPVSPPAGWYQDPGGSGGLRYWDGSTWTGHVTPPPPAAAPPVATTGPPVPVRPPTQPAARTPVWVWVALGLTIVAIGLGGVVAVAVPAFRGAREAIWDEEAKATLDSSWAAAASLRGSGSYVAVTPEALDGFDPEVDHTAAASTHDHLVSVYALPDRMTLALQSRGGTCWVIRDEPTGVRRGRAGDERPCLAATIESFEEEAF